jgi:hypothetical protein
MKVFNRDSGDSYGVIVHSSGKFYRVIPVMYVEEIYMGIPMPEDDESIQDEVLKRLLGENSTSASHTYSTNNVPQAKYILEYNKGGLKLEDVGYYSEYTLEDDARTKVLEIGLSGGAVKYIDMSLEEFENFYLNAPSIEELEESIFAGTSEDTDKECEDIQKSIIDGTDLSTIN